VKLLNKAPLSRAAKKQQRKAQGNLTVRHATLIHILAGGDLQSDLLGNEICFFQPAERENLAAAMEEVIG
jgi:hypothetical protein